MPETTYLQTIMADWQAAAGDVATALAAAGVEPLLAWYTGEPVPLPTGMAPLAWWAWRAEATRDISEALDSQTEEIKVIFVVAVGGASPAELMAAEAVYVPTIKAALESRTWDFQPSYLGGDRMLDPGGLVSWTAMVWSITIDREIGGV